MVAGQVFEVLAEEVGVENGYHATVQGCDLCTLVGDALYFSNHAVTFDVIAYTHTSRHEGNAVEEVFQEALRGEAHTR